MSNNFQKKQINNPYPGIRSFNVDENDLFFGREEQILDLANLLQKNHFSAISGASGSGKSSIVKAGIIPWFERNFENSDYIIFRPGNNPIKNLSNSLALFFQKQGLDRKLVKKSLLSLHKDTNALTKILEEFSTGKPMLIYIDQFEEIFRYRTNELNSNSEELSNYFIQNLISSITAENSNVYLIFSLRSDFLSECSVFTGLPELINKGHYLLPAMTDEQKEAAITMPAKKAGATFSDELMKILRTDIQTHKIKLPVLQHALMRTWDNWLLNSPPGAPIDVNNYVAIGTVDKALSYHAEDIYNSLTEEQKKLTEKIFMALTFLGDDERGIRSPQKLGDLCDITSAKEMEIIEVVDKFRAEGNSFLLPHSSEALTRNTIIDISHESIMSLWERLVEWVEKETQSAHLYVRLSKSAELFQAGKTGILVNPDLQIAINWLENDKPNAAWAKRYDPTFDRVVNYIFYSRKEYQKSVEAEQISKERSLKRTRFVAIILGVASLISILLMILALNMRFKAVQSEKEALAKKQFAERQSIIAENRRKEAVALQLVAGQQQQIAEENRLLAEQQKRYAVAQQREALFQKQQAFIARNDAIDAKNLAQRLQQEAEALRDEAIEQKLLIEQQKQRAELSEQRTDTLRRLAVAKTLAIKAFQLYYDNLKADNLSDEDKNLPAILTLQSYYFNKKNNGNLLDPDIFTALLTISGQNIEIKNNHTDAVRGVTVLNDGNVISVGSDGKMFLLSTLTNNQESQFYTGSNSNIDFRNVQVSPDEKFVLAGTKDGKIFMWKDGDYLTKPVSKSQSSYIISAIEFLSNNSFVVADKSGKIVLYSINDISFVKTKELDLTESIVDITIVGSKIIVATDKGSIHLLTSELVEESSFVSTYGSISCVTSASSNQIFVGHTNGLVELLNIDGTEVAKWFAHTSAVTEILVDKFAGTVITSGYDKSIKIWNLSNLTAQPIVINEHHAWIYSIALSQNGKYLISADALGVIRKTLINVDDLKEVVKQGVTKNMSEQNWIKYVGEGIEYSPDLPSDL